MRAAIEKAKSTGIAAAGVRNAGHFGAAACFTMMAVEERMVGFATHEYRGSVRRGAGRRRTCRGEQPAKLCATGGRGTPIVLDMACGASAWGKILTMNLYGQPVPKEWFLGGTEKRLRIRAKGI